MTTNNSATSLWARVWNWLLLLDAALNYDSTQYTFDRIKGLQDQIDLLTLRIEQLEQDSESMRSTNTPLLSAQKH
ncbi:hypothetical protein [Acaryochloris sp. IP29b_bin.137]|uniref:hypothetical protein n=1 Tax=Acaryochloris sp. IP29b_bin.137 TaxID=2969217 RepID=UPI00261CB490|nr:hypothetical protein [Acaryochloris sp. IP29b_bin.137]